MLRLEPFDIEVVFEKASKNEPFLMRPPILPEYHYSENKFRKLLFQIIWLIMLKMSVELHGLLNVEQPDYSKELMQAFFPASHISQFSIVSRGMERRGNLEFFDEIPENFVFMEGGGQSYSIKQHLGYTPYLIYQDDRAETGQESRLNHLIILYIPQKTLVNPTVDMSLMQNLLSGLLVKYENGKMEIEISKSSHRNPIALREYLLSHKVCYKETSVSSLLRANYHVELERALLTKIQKLIYMNLIGTWYSVDTFLLQLEDGLKLFFPLCKVTKRKGDKLLDFFKGSNLYVTFDSSRPGIDIKSFLRAQKYIMSYESDIQSRKNNLALERRRQELREALLRFSMTNEFDKGKYCAVKDVLKTNALLIHASNSIIDPGMVLAFDQELVYFTTVPVIVRRSEEGFDYEIISIRYVNEPEMRLDRIIRAKPKKIQLQSF